MSIVEGRVGLDGFVSVRAEYNPDERWNGWLCPRMSRDSAVQVLDMLIAEAPDDPPYSYEFEGDVLTLVDQQNPHEPPERIEPDHKGLYALGAGSWVWSADEEPKAVERHLRMVGWPDRADG